MHKIRRIKMIMHLITPTEQMATAPIYAALLLLMGGLLWWLHHSQKGAGA